MKPASRQRFISIKQKILSVLAGVFVILLAISMLFIYKNLQHVTYRNFEENVHSIAKIIELTVDELPPEQWKNTIKYKSFHDSDSYVRLLGEVQKYIDQFESIEYIHITLNGTGNERYWLVNTDDTIDYTNPSGTIALIPEADKEFWSEAGSYFFKDKTHNTFIVRTEMRNSLGEVIGDIGIGVTTKSIHAQLLSAMQVYLFVFIGIFAAIIVAFVLLIYRIVLKPLDQITSAVKEIDYSVEKLEVREISHFSNDEVYLLYSSIKKMLSELRKYIDFSRKATWDAEHDAMTKLYNKRRFHNMYSIYSASTSIGILAFDINFLKQTNDGLGHSAGDVLIQKAASSIRGIINEKVHGYRMGGDEFLVVCLDLTQEHFQNIIETWKSKLEELNTEGDTCSMAYGHAYGTGKLNIDELLQQADTDMYENKKEMKNGAE